MQLLRARPAQLKRHAMSPQHFADCLSPRRDARGVGLLSDAHAQRLKQHPEPLSGWRVTVLLNGREGMIKNGQWSYDVWVGLRTPEESHVSTAACTTVQCKALTPSGLSRMTVPVSGSTVCRTPRCELPSKVRSDQAVEVELAADGVDAHAVDAHGPLVGMVITLPCTG